MHLISERSQIQKTTCCMVLFNWHSAKGKTVETENTHQWLPGVGKRLTAKGLAQGTF